MIALIYQSLNIKNMNLNLEEFESENKVVKSPTVDEAFVDQFINAIEKCPYEVRLRFKTFDFLPGIRLTMYHTGRFKEELSSIANDSLINSIIRAMGGKLDAILDYRREGDKSIKDTTDNFELEMFECFIKSKYRLSIEKDFISDKGNKFLHAVCSISKRRDIHFYLKRDEHIEALLKELMTAN